MEAFRPVLRSLVVAVVAAVLLAGCTGSGGSTPSPTPSGPATSESSSSPSPTPTRTGPLTTGPGVRPGEKPPVLDDAARKHDQTGAILFAQYFVRALDWSFATTDPYLLERVSLKTCTACSRYIHSLRKLAAEGGNVVGGRFVLHGAALLHGDFAFKADYVVQVTITQQPVVIRRPSAAPSTVTSTPTTTHSRVYVSWVGGVGWRVAEEGGE